ncbi:NUDIX domain-containing protein [Candidatus Woesearchaeota archaeon]|nr:NUDIX domain-containing protein [Candidatus Woesearchaeota archaeon]
MGEKKRVGVGFGVLIRKGNLILLGKRHDDPKKASSELRGEGTWTMPGGKLEFGESFEEGAIREVREETGIQVKKVRIMCINNDRVEGAHFVTIGMMCESFIGEPHVCEPDEITQWRWFSLDALPTPLFFASRKILDNIRENIFYRDATARE